ncbi:spermatogenesis-associated protein 24-like [Littorina saxatilis]|uniref:spermatogenesis-associated protein 24-like n=1 Tax=Littorina saxatilis TaxID=31220 RepID=UPI0038B4B9CA
MMAASECAHVVVDKIDDEISMENSADDMEDLSSIVEPVTPVHVIVQRQIREVLLLQNAAVEHLHESMTGQETFIRDHLVPREEHFTKLKEVEQTLQQSYVTREEYDELTAKLEHEQHSHAQTKLRLMEVTDKLDFTLSEVDILSKQLSKEKDTFQHIVDSLRSQVAKGNSWNQELDGKYAACQRQCQELEGRLASREATIEALEQRLAEQQKECEHKMEEKEIEKQQDQYVQRMMDQQKNGRCKKSVNKTNSALKVKR